MNNLKYFFRVLASLIYDAVLVFGVVLAGYTIVYVPVAIFIDNHDIGGHPLFLPYILVLLVGFHVWFWINGGQTLGMRTWRLKLVRNDGGQLTIKDALARYLFAIISMACLGLGYFWILIDVKGRSWHDLFSKTLLEETSVKDKSDN